MKHTKIIAHSPAYDRITDKIPVLVGKLAEKILAYESGREIPGNTDTEDIGSLPVRETYRRYDMSGKLLEEKNKTVDLDDMYNSIKYQARRFGFTVDVNDSGVATLTRHNAGNAITPPSKTVVTFEPQWNAKEA